MEQETTEEEWDSGGSPVVTDGSTPPQGCRESREGRIRSTRANFTAYMKAQRDLVVLSVPSPGPRTVYRL